MGSWSQSQSTPPPITYWLVRPTSRRASGSSARRSGRLPAPIPGPLPADPGRIRCTGVRPPKRNCHLRSRRVAAGQPPPPAAGSSVQNTGRHLHSSSTLAILVVFTGQTAPSSGQTTGISSPPHTPGHPLCTRSAVVVHKMSGFRTNGRPAGSRLVGQPGGHTFRQGRRAGIFRRIQRVRPGPAVLRQPPVHRRQVSHPQELVHPSRPEYRTGVRPVRV